MRKLLNLADVLLTLSVAGCAASSTGNKPAAAPPPIVVNVTVSPESANIRSGDAFPFSAAVSGTTDTAVTWAVNGTPGGTLGTISANGNYSAPAALPNPNTISVRATSTADANARGSSSVTLLNPTPVLTGINPASVGTGNFTLTVTGNKFVNGAQVFLGAVPIQTTFVPQRSSLPMVLQLPPEPIP